MKAFGNFVVKFVAAAAILVALCYLLNATALPPGVWYRKVVRNNPLKSPVAVQSIDGATLVTAQGRYALAGVSLPTDARMRSRALEFLQTAAAQGIEITRSDPATRRSLVRCEPRIHHWCGNDAVAAHYQQFNLNELIIATGFAHFDAGDEWISAEERLRLAGAQAAAEQMENGIWSRNQRNDGPDFSRKHGISISDTSLLSMMIDHCADELESRGNGQAR